MKQKPSSRRKRSSAKSVLRLPDLEHAKAAVLNSLNSTDAKRGYRHAIDEFVDWYCSEPRLAFNRIVVLRYRSHLESRQLAPGTINLRLGAVRRLAYEAADCGLATMQTSCLRLMGKKLLVALTMEGKFAGEGLQSIDEDDDMLSAMARELVQSNGIGESADAVWKALHTEHQKLFPTTSPSNEVVACLEAPGSLLTTPSDSASRVEGAIEGSPVLIFGQRPGSLSGRRPRGRAPVPEQASLFG
jgi:hypothetical protein